MKGYKKYGILLASALILLSSFPGCGRRSGEPEAERQSAEEQSEEIPEELEAMEESIEKIIEALDGPSVQSESMGEKEREGRAEMEQKEEQDVQGEETGEEQGSDEKQGTQENDGNRQQEEGQEGQETKPKEEEEKKQQPEDPWQEIAPVINNLHYTWNSYMPAAVKKGAGGALLDNFSTALNSLTNTIISKNKTNTLLAASYLYAYVPDFYSLYRTSSSPDIKRVRHYIRNAMLNAMTANWTQSDTDMANLKSTWSLYKNTIPPDLQDSSSMLDFSILELEKVIAERNQPLTDIKGRVSLANIMALEKAVKESENGKAQDDEDGGIRED